MLNRGQPPKRKRVKIGELKGAEKEVALVFVVLLLLRVVCFDEAIIALHRSLQAAEAKLRQRREEQKAAGVKFETAREVRVSVVSRGCVARRN